MTKHTPGPWVWIQTDTDGKHRIGSDTGLVGWAADRSQYGAGESNAHLIAAAPELLAACEDAQTIAQELCAALEGVCEGKHGGSAEDAAECSNILRAAIRKARGE